jgi:hypothetical protein
MPPPLTLGFRYVTDSRALDLLQILHHVNPIVRQAFMHALGNAVLRTGAIYDSLFFPRPPTCVPRPCRIILVVVIELEAFDINNKSQNPTSSSVVVIA